MIHSADPADFYVYANHCCYQLQKQWRCNGFVLSSWLFCLRMSKILHETDVWQQQAVSDETSGIDYVT